MKITCLIPARSGSKRVPNKNIRELSGKPLISYTIEIAIKSQIFDKIIIVTDSREYAQLAESYGVVCPKLRPKNISSDTSPDIDWLLWAIKEFKLGDNNQCVAILRPTSPFRKVDTLLETWDIFRNSDADSLRAISEVTEHPGKMWTLNNKTMTPLLPFKLNNVPWHSSQKTVLPKVYVQNASLEIVSVSSIVETQSISGEIILPYISKGYEGFDINDEIDFLIAEYLINNNMV